MPSTPVPDAQYAIDEALFFLANRGYVRQMQLMPYAVHPDEQMRIATARRLAESGIHYPDVIDALIRTEIAAAGVQHPYWSPALDIISQSAASGKPTRKPSRSQATELLEDHLEYIGDILCTDAAGRLTTGLLRFRSPMLIREVAQSSAGLREEHLNLILGEALRCSLPTLEKGLLINPDLTMDAATLLATHLVYRFTERRRHQAMNIAAIVPLLARLHTMDATSRSFPQVRYFAMHVVRFGERGLLTGTALQQATDLAAKMLVGCGTGHASKYPDHFIEALQVPSEAIRLAVLAAA